MSEPEMTIEEEEAALAELGMTREQWERTRALLSDAQLSRLSEGGTFLIYCNAAGHSRKSVKIKTLHLSTFARLTSATTLLQGRSPLARPTLKDMIFNPGTGSVRAEVPRQHFKFRCPRCGLDVSVPGDRFWRVVDDVAGHGESKLSLSELTAKLAFS